MKQWNIGRENNISYKTLIQRTWKYAQFIIQIISQRYFMKKIDTVYIIFLGLSMTCSES